MGRQKVILPNNVPPENFKHIFEATDERRVAISWQNMTLFLLVFFLLSIIIGAVSFLVFNSKISTIFKFDNFTDVCQQGVCPDGSICLTGADGETVCECVETCWNHKTDPVCGSDGVIVSIHKIRNKIMVCFFSVQ